MESTENKTIIEESESVESMEFQEVNNTKEICNDNNIDYFSMEQTDLINHLKSVVEQAKNTDVKNEIDTIKVAFYKKHKSIVDKQRKEFIEQGGAEEDFAPQASDIDEIFKDFFKFFIISNNKH